MVTFGTYEAKAKFTALLARAEAGEEIIITRHGKPVAKLVPVARDTSRSVEEIFADLRAIRERIRASGGGMSAESIVDLIRQGRRY